MSSFHVGGIVSGLDTETIISQLVAAASVPKKVLQAKQSGLQDRQDAYTELSSRLTDLQTALTDIDTQTEFRSVSGSSSDESIADVTVDGDGVVCSPARYRASQRSRASPAVSLIDGANRACRGMGRMQGGYWPTGIAKSPRTSRQVQ